ncbi:MAG: CehA/McbA family metallohydrolase [Anaerolineae bacterium]|nr:CehA/McbA family metallohydrolase [Anaerolineae bacterium]
MDPSDRPPHYVFEDTLSPKDCKRYLLLPFDVPPGTTRLRLDFQYEPKRVAWPKDIGNLLCLSLLDPHGFRGAQHSEGNRKVVEIGPSAATPGFVPGPLPAGRWTLEVDVFLVLPGEPVNYRAEVRLASEAPGREASREVVTGAWRPQPPLRRQPGWYRGDLHTHTVHSDGSQTVAQFLDIARQRRLDYVALTDHNTISQLADPALDGCRDLAIVPGMELTTHYGHAVSLGTPSWIDWRTGHDGRTIGQALAQVRTEGGLSVLAHLAAFGDPACTGCTWLYTDQMPGALDAMEVWNGFWFQVGNNNPVTLRIWKEWLQAGHRLPAVAGTDFHSPKDYGPGAPFSVVHARELSAAGIVEGVARGHVMVSAGPELYLQATLADGGVAIMGDAVEARAVRAVQMRWLGAPDGARVLWLVDGEVLAAWEGAHGEASPALPGGSRWALAEMWGPDGALLAVTNPLYLRSGA